MTVFAIGLALVILIGCIAVVAYDEAERRWGHQLRAWWDA